MTERVKKLLRQIDNTVTEKRAHEIVAEIKQWEINEALVIFKATILHTTISIAIKQLFLNDEEYFYQLMEEMGYDRKNIMAGVTMLEKMYRDQILRGKQKVKND